MSAQSPEARYREDERKARLSLERKTIKRRVELTPRQVSAIRSDRAEGVPQDELARRFGICTQRVRAICKGEES